MAIFRKIHVSFWSDAYISNLKEREKLLYVYLLTNERTTQCGIYEITKRQISFDLGYSIDTVSVLLKKFESDRKIRYNDLTSEIAIKNWNKYNENSSGKVKVLVDRELLRVKDRDLIQYIYSIDTISIHIQQEEQEQEQEKEVEQDQKKTASPDPLKEDLILVSPFDPSFYSDHWKRWVEYKHIQHKFKFKVKESEQIAFNQLVKLSNSNHEVAAKIIDQSMVNGWKGLFELKDQKKIDNTSLGSDDFMSKDFYEKAAQKVKDEVERRRKTRGL